MTLKISSIADAGNLQKERVVMTATSDINLTEFAVFCCSKGRHIRSGDIPRVYWFNVKKIKPGDLVVLYTKKGQDSEKTLNDSRTSHFFYWDLDEPLWIGSRSAVCVYTPSWSIADIPPEE